MKGIRHVGTVGLITMLILVAVSTSTAAKIDKIISAVQKKYRSLQTLRIEFRQISRFQLTKTESEIYGTLLLSGKDKFRLETEDQVMVSNGETFWRYNKLDQQVLIDYPKKEDQEVLFRDFLYDIKDKYFAELVEEKKDGKKKIFVVKLIPKESDQSFFTSIKVWLEDKSWKIRRVVYRDYNDNETEFQIEHMELNPQFSPATFEFAPPEGVEVVDLRFE
ncbi:MAG: outer membrane lipoprotein carrier protein LolA [Calditrichaeota bacterium]|nr:outer membrane lipoprotein carrier protein LolA [Calditrichota bacterium]